MALKVQIPLSRFSSIIVILCIRIFCLVIGGGFGVYLFIDKLFFGGFNVTGPRAILSALLILSGLQFSLFAMFFDMEEGKNIGT